MNTGYLNPRSARCAAATIAQFFGRDEQTVYNAVARTLIAAEILPKSAGRYHASLHAGQFGSLILGTLILGQRNKLVADTAAMEALPIHTDEPGLGLRHLRDVFALPYASASDFDEDSEELRTYRLLEASQIHIWRNLPVAQVTTPAGRAFFMRPGTRLSDFFTPEVTIAQAHVEFFRSEQHVSSGWTGARDPVDDFISIGVRAPDGLVTEGAIVSRAQWESMTPEQQRAYLESAAETA